MLLQTVILKQSHRYISCHSISLKGRLIKISLAGFGTLSSLPWDMPPGQMGKRWKQLETLFWGGSKITADGDFSSVQFSLGFPGGSEIKASAWNAGDLGWIPGSGRSPGEGNGSPLQYSCLENPRDGGAQWASVYGVAQSWTRLKQLTSSGSRLQSMGSQRVGHD